MCLSDSCYDFFKSPICNCKMRQCKMCALMSNFSGPWILIANIRDVGFATIYYNLLLKAGEYSRQLRIAKISQSNQRLANCIIG